LSLSFSHSVPVRRGVCQLRPCQCCGRQDCAVSRLPLSSGPEHAGPHL